MYDHAIEMGLAQNNPARNTRLPRQPRRAGELLALQWKHINFRDKTISIQQSVAQKLTFDDEGRTVTIANALGATKTRTSQRVLQAPDIMLTRLREWMRYAATLKGGLNTLTPEGFVFLSTHTMGMRTYSGFQASYCHFLERNGFGGEGLNLHRYRQTYASMLLEQEINPKIVQKLLGHRDMKMLTKVYDHTTVDTLWEAITSTKRKETE